MRLLLILVALLSSSITASQAGTVILDPPLVFESEALQLCAGSEEAQDFADRLQAARVSGALPDAVLIERAPHALIKLAEIERRSGRLDQAKKDDDLVAKLKGFPETFWLDRKLRINGLGPHKNETIYAAERIKRKGLDDFLVVLWKADACDDRSDIPMSWRPATLALYQLGATGMPRPMGAPIKKVEFASEISTAEILADGRAIVSISAPDGNCLLCEQRFIDFLIDNSGLHELKSPGVGILLGPPQIVNGVLYVVSADLRWQDPAGYYDRARTGSFVATQWRAEPRGFVDVCTKGGPFDDSDPAKGDSPEETVFEATDRFTAAVQAGQVDRAWPRYKRDLEIIARWWPDEKPKLDNYVRKLGHAIARSKPGMARHACPLEGLKFSFR